MCCVAGVGNIETVAEGLLLSKPYVYDSNLPAALSSTFPRVNSVLHRGISSPGCVLSHCFHLHCAHLTPPMAALLTRVVQQEEGKNISIIHTVGGQQFTFFAKNEKWGKVRAR
jgi:hypothetical protein